MTVLRSADASANAGMRSGFRKRDVSEPGVSYAYISRLEAGAQRPSVLALRKLAPKLGVSVAWLEAGEDDAAVELAKLVLEHEGTPPPRATLRLARRVLS